MIEQHASGSISITGRASINLARLIATRSALRLFVKTGLSMVRGTTPLAIAKKELGLPRNLNKQKVLAIYDDYVAQVEELYKVRGLCPKCNAEAIVPLTAVRGYRALPNDTTTHVCHPWLGGCNYGFSSQ